jgi:uncharacterized protein YbbC (DUF1343 family)
MTYLKTGLDQLASDPSLGDGWGKVAFATNQTSISSGKIPLFQIAQTHFAHSTVCILGPQHGFWQTEQDNMKETMDDQFPWPNQAGYVPLYSLYSEVRTPTPNMLQGVDTIVVDFQDIGCRVYTYMLTLAGILRAVHNTHIKVVVLDRPNPLGLGYKDIDNTNHELQGNIQGVYGPVLDMALQSFVGWYPIPVQHGLTLGELGRYFIHYDVLQVDYSVIPVMHLNRTHRGAVLWESFHIPSPNMPSPLSAIFFPAFVLLEAVYCSEGRGTTVPFQWVGAPYIDPSAVIQYLRAHRQVWDPKQCISMQPMAFTPTFNKFQGQVCQGIYFHIKQTTDANTNFTTDFNSFALGCLFITYISHSYPHSFAWKEKGYEYNFTHNPLDLIVGCTGFMQLLTDICLQDNITVKTDKVLDWLHTTQQQAHAFYNHSKQFWLYTIPQMGSFQGLRQYYSPTNTGNMVCFLSWRGTNHVFGFQKQAQGLTVMGILEHAWHILTKETTHIIGCSRLDTGVHASQFVANWQTKSNLDLPTITDKLNGILKYYYPDCPIYFYKCHWALPHFNARFHSQGKYYIYRLWVGAGKMGHSRDFPTYGVWHARRAFYDIFYSYL